MTAAFQRSVKPGWVIAPNAITPKDLVVIPSSTYHSFANTIRQILETRPSQKTVSIISFNYDIGLDFALVYNGIDRKSTRLNSSHTVISYAVFCLKKKKKQNQSNLQK